MESNPALTPATVQGETDNNAASSVKEQGIAWLVHLFTATGAIWGFLSIIAINQQQWRLAFLWIAIAVLVDGLDGFLARAAHVHRVLPNFDGALLDNIVDYLNYVFVPAYFLYAAGLLPQQLELVLPITVLLASAYQFSQSDAKTDDHFFKGFPSYWNIVVVYLIMLGVSPWISAAIILFFSVMVFIPIKYIYPSRTNILPRLTLALGLVWAIMMVVMGILFPDQPAWLVWLSLLYPAYYYAIEFLSHVQDERQDAGPGRCIAGRKIGPNPSDESQSMRRIPEGVEPENGSSDTTDLKTSKPSAETTGAMDARTANASDMVDSDVASLQYDQGWLSSFMRPFLIVILAVCLNLALLVFLRRFMPSLASPVFQTILVLSTIAALSGAITSTWLAQPAQRSRRTVGYRMAEWALLILLTRIVLWILTGDIPTLGRPVHETAQQSI